MLSAREWIGLGFLSVGLDGGDDELELLISSLFFCNFATDNFEYDYWFSRKEKQT